MKKVKITVMRKVRHDDLIEKYEKGEEDWSMVASRRLKHPVTQFHKTDLGMYKKRYILL